MLEATRESVVQKVRELWPGEDTARIMTLLDEYGVESYEREKHRVQLAVLKLSEGDLDRVLEFMTWAKRDYRDVLAYAEYPNEMRTPPSTMQRLPPEDAAVIRKGDRAQYEQWLQRKPREDAP